MPTPNDMPGAATDTQTVEPKPDDQQEPQGQPGEDTTNGNGQHDDDDDLNAEVKDPVAEIERLRKIVRQGRKFEDRARKNAEKARKWDENAEKLAQFEEWQKQQQTKEERLAELEKDLAEERLKGLRKDIAAEMSVPVRFVTGKTEAEMRESAEEYISQRDADIDARLKAMNITPAAPASSVTSDGKGNEVKQLTRADLATMSRKDILAAEKNGQMDEVLGRTR